MENSKNIQSIILLIACSLSLVSAQSIPVCIGSFKIANGVSVCSLDANNQQRPADERDCVFPFLYNGVWQDRCITTSDKTGPWCSLNKVYADGLRASCASTCPRLAKSVMLKDPTQTHTSCIDVLPTASAIIPTDAEIQTILNDHNNLRAQVSPTASDMVPLSWDHGLSRLAQRWAQNGKFAHDCNSCRTLINNSTVSVGQNIYMTTAAYDASFWKNAVSAWGSEIKYFSYGSASGSTTGNWMDVGHYTQQVNSKTVRVGCGASLNAGKLMAVCNYANGQSDIAKPYTSGASCSACASGSCVNNMCQCNKLCQNKGVLNLATCTCTCPAYATGDQCQTLSCSKTDLEYGCWAKDASYCKYSNIPPICPHMCGICDLS